MRGLVTGANGFVGRAACTALRQAGHVAAPAVRRPCGLAEEHVVGEIGPHTDWRAALTGCEAVVHLAARVHVMRDHTQDPLSLYRAVNTGGTLNLARQAAAVGVKRFVFISSIKVNGEETPPGQPFDADSPLAPADPYGVSKMEAERSLRELSTQTGMEVVIIRPPLVYGPGVKGNFLILMQWLCRGIPLPLGAIHNQRSLIALDNLVDLIVTCMAHPAAANQTFLVADGEDLSTSELLRRVGRALGRPARLIPMPARLLELGAAMAGKRDLARRLCGSLQVDSSRARQALGWRPPLGVDEGLRRAARHVLGRGG